MKVEEWIKAVKACPVVGYNEHYWSMEDRKSHTRTGRCYVLGKRRGGKVSTVDVSILKDPNSHAVWCMAKDSTTRRLAGAILRKPEELR